MSSSENKPEIQFKSVHLAFPVRNLESAQKFFQSLFGAEIKFTNLERRTSTVAYDKFEFSLFEMPDFKFEKADLGPFHIGHEVAGRDAVDHLYRIAIENQYDVKSSPFDREDGDYAFFIIADQGIVFEFFCGGHRLAMGAGQK